MTSSAKCKYQSPCLRLLRACGHDLIKKRIMWVQIAAKRGGVVGDKVALLETLHSDITAGNVILRPGTCQAQAD